MKTTDEGMLPTIIQNYQPVGLRENVAQESRLYFKKLRSLATTRG